MSKTKRRHQANRRGAFALGLTADELAQWIVKRLKPHHLARWAERRVAA